VIATTVTFAYGDGFDRARIEAVAKEARATFDGMPGLRFKAFTLAEDRRCAQNLYIWDDEDAARAFFSPELAERVTELYGVAPKIAFAEVAELVDNTGV
jgi:heme-degrading monooxygenase HmoA